MKILVTGSTGFIGNYVIGELLKQKHDVIATSKDIIKAKSCKWFNDVNYISCDLNKSFDNYFTFFDQPELLIHLAWENLPNYNDLFHFERNLITNCRFLRNIIENGLRKLIVTGTCLEYGMQSGVLKEDMLTVPDSSYGLAKDTLRKYLEQLRKKLDFDLKWLRLFYVYGEGQSTNSLFSQLDFALDNGDDVFNMSGGEQLRDYLPVERVAGYIVKISMQDKVTGIINCCSGKPISIRKLVENHLKKRDKLIRLNFGYYPYPDYEPMAFWGCDRKLQMALNKGDDA